MEVKQIYDFVNNAVKQATGQENLLVEDLSNVVAVGTAILNANALDKYVDALVNHIGRVVFVTRPYRGVYAKLQMDAWEFGSVMEKITMELPKAEENESWDLTDGSTYEENQFYQPKVTAKFYNKMTTFEIPMSITEKQVKQSFSNATQLNSFLSMIYTAIENALTIKIEELSRRAVNNMIAETAYDFYGAGSQTASSGIRAVNLLYLYNTMKGTSLTREQARFDEDFLKFAFYTIATYKNRMASMSVLFNMGGKERFTPADRLKFILLSDFAKASEVYLQSDTFHNELVKLDGYMETPYFQGTGTSYAFDDISTIKCKTADGHTITIEGVVGVLLDTDSVAITNFNRRVTSKWNAKAEFTNYWYKCDGSYINDGNENCVFFFLA